MSDWTRERLYREFPIGKHVVVVAEDDQWPEPGTVCVVIGHHSGPQVWVCVVSGGDGMADNVPVHPVDLRPAQPDEIANARREWMEHGGFSDAPDEPAPNLRAAIELARPWGDLDYKPNNGCECFGRARAIRELIAAAETAIRALAAAREAT